VEGEKSKDEEEMDVDGKEAQKERNEVFLSPEEQAKAAAAAATAAAEAAAAAADMAKAASMEEAKRERERRRKEEQERNERRKEEARLASELGRELGRKAVKSKVDNRYHAVRSIRSARQAGRELNKAVGPGSPVDSGLGGFLGDDERWFRNYNIHNVERGVNVSCSFNPRSGLCYTCLGEPHKAWQGTEGQPVVLILSDQCFPANVPAAD
jgi:nitric oxide reductase activation protein